jgi:flavin reductase (DIM6/NTAB) family NADH-FMN oxidoreductase RutF
MSRFASGVAVVTTLDGEKREGLTVNSFSSAIARSAIGRLEPEEKLAVVGHILARDRICCKYPCADLRDLSHHFATPHPNKVLGVEYDDRSFGFPVFSDNLAMGHTEADRNEGRTSHGCDRRRSWSDV